VIAVVVFCIVSWSQVIDVMSRAQPGMSPLNPLDAGKVQDYNLWFVVMGVITRIYATNASQNRQGFNAAARTAHESRMGGLLGEWRQYARNLMILVLGVCAVAYMQHPSFARRGPAGHRVAPGHRRPLPPPADERPGRPELPAADRDQGSVRLGHGDGTAGRRQRAPALLGQHLRAGRPPAAEEERADARPAHVGASAGRDRVAVFAFTFSVVWTQTQYINLWWLITGGIFTGGAGAAIVGGLYWRRGTTAAAWAGTLTGCVLSLVGMVLGSFLEADRRRRRDRAWRRWASRFPRSSGSTSRFPAFSR
jgi:SSS family solute:Na+ symporter